MCLVSLSASNASPFFHTANVIAAILRATVTRASSGRSPRSNNLAYQDLNGSHLEAVSAALLKTYFNVRLWSCVKPRVFAFALCRISHRQSGGPHSNVFLRPARNTTRTDAWSGNDAVSPLKRSTAQCERCQVSGLDAISCLPCDGDTRRAFLAALHAASPSDGRVRNTIVQRERELWLPATSQATLRVAAVCRHSFQRTRWHGSGTVP